MTNIYGNQVRDGMDVYDLNDDKLGTVEAVYDSTSKDARSGGGYLQVPTGFLGLGTEHHIPFSAIKNVRNDRIFLNVAKDRLNELGFDAAPVETDDDFDGTVRDRTITTSDSPRTSAETPNPRGRDQGERRLQLREEELIPRKRSVQIGEVNVQTKVVEEQRTLEVPVTREEVTIERRPIDRRPSDTPIAEGQTISVPVREEQVEVDKRAVVYEEVNVNKRQVQDTERVSDTVRREEARIEREGDARLATAGEGWAQAMPTYRQQWQTRYGTTGGRWEDAEPGYRYGYDLNSRAEYRGRPWADVEPELRRDWGQRYPDKPWDRVKESVRETWESARGR